MIRNVPLLQYYRFEVEEVSFRDKSDLPPHYLRLVGGLLKPEGTSLTALFEVGRGRFKGKRGLPRLYEVRGGGLLIAKRSSAPTLNVVGG